jgi:uncharacterized protein
VNRNGALADAALARIDLRVVDAIVDALEIEGPLLAALGGGYACRAGCGACCIALSISSAIPGMPDGKPAGVRCVQLDAANRCLIFGRSNRPEVCARLRPDVEMCGSSRRHAMQWIAELEALTAPMPSDVVSACRPKISAASTGADATATAPRVESLRKNQTEDTMRLPTLSGVMPI